MRNFINVIAGNSKQNTNLCGQVLRGLVQVNCHILAFNACYAAHHDLLTQQGGSIGGELFNGLTLEGCGLQLFQSGCVSRDSSLQHVTPEGDEGFGLSHEVGFRIDLNHVTNAVFYASCNQTFSGCTTFTLGDALQTLHTDNLHCLLLVAVSLIESLLDVEHTCAGLLTQCLDVCCSVVRHVNSSFSLI